MPPDPLAPSRNAFDRVQRQVVIKDLWAHLRGEPAALLPFEEVRQKLRLSNPAYRGIVDVALDDIIGSFSRYTDFTRTFLPRQSVTRDRWASVHRLAADKGLPPVELYQVGEAYFVSDGHHRISVARQNGWRMIQAHVYQYPTCAALGPGATFEDVLIQEEYLAFLTRTGLDASRPEHTIHFTSLGRFNTLECQITAYQAALSLIDHRPFEYQEAAAYWYDMYYTPIVQVIRRREVLSNFPGRTESDLFVWVTTHQPQLGEAYGYGMPIFEAADHIRDHHDTRWSRRLLRRLKERLRGHPHTHSGQE